MVEGMPHAAEGTSKTELLKLTTDIVVSHVANNHLAAADLPKLIRDVYTSLTGIPRLPAPGRRMSGSENVHSRPSPFANP